MDDFRLDGRKWRFLDDPVRYLEREDRDARWLKLEPLRRQFETAKAILDRLADGRGALLADDVGLGKTTVGAIVAWVVACQEMRVRIYAPNVVLQRRWAEELERHVPMLRSIGASNDRIRTGDVGKLHAGRIQVATHHVLVESHGNNEQRTGCDLMIIDEAHRAKGCGSAFNEALRRLGDRAKRKLILTATPFGIRIAELEQLLRFVGATELEAVRRYADDLDRLHKLGDGHDVGVEASRLVATAKAAIEELRRYVIRHGIDDLTSGEKACFGSVDPRWDIATPPASVADISLLLRMDRLLQLVPERKGERRNDPRFHIGWQHVDTELRRADERSRVGSDRVLRRHIEEASTALAERRAGAHPKMAAVVEAIRSLQDEGEKVLVFCHHRATAGELLGALERSFSGGDGSSTGPRTEVWRAAWKSSLRGVATVEDEGRLDVIIEWLCARGNRRQITRWIEAPASTAERLAKQLAEARPRGGGGEVPTVLEAAIRLVRALLDPQSKSTRAVLDAIAKKKHAFHGADSRLPGQLDDAQPVMGSWTHDGGGDPPKTLYARAPDIVLALFNSPFGPDVLVTTDRLSEGVDLHRYCRHLIHYELDPSPVRTLQRNGRVRRVDSWASVTRTAIKYAYPTFGGTRDEKAVEIMRRRIGAFGLLLGGVPEVDADADDGGQRFADAVLAAARKQLATLNRRLCV